jgi:hypothetical protein
MYQHLPLQDPPKVTQIWIFGLKTNHLATLVPTQLASVHISSPKNLTSVLIEKGKLQALLFLPFPANSCESL